MDKQQELNQSGLKTINKPLLFRNVFVKSQHIKPNVFVSDVEIEFNDNYNFYVNDEYNPEFNLPNIIFLNLVDMLEKDRLAFWNKIDYIICPEDDYLRLESGLSGCKWVSDIADDFIFQDSLARIDNFEETDKYLQYRLTK